MVRFPILLVVYFAASILVLVQPNVTTAATITSTGEEQIRQLWESYSHFKQIVEAKNIQLEMKVSQLELKNKQLETQVQQQNEMKKDMELKVTHLNEKLTQWEAKEQNILAEKLTRLEVALSFAEQKTSRQAGKNVISRTCREACLTDPTLSSGMYWIDPDGQGVGDDPIYVHCDMKTGTTSIPHDKESSTDVGHCADPGCYSRAVNYNASSRQITALAELSAECHQSIRYDCNFAPLEFNEMSYSWWNDKNGNSKTFWAGSNTAIHTCQCGLDGNCVDPSVKCNCDSMAPVPLTDNGVITDKNVLPITRLNFGRTQLETSSGVHTLGRFECTGQVAVSGMPTSCEDLWRGGHTLNGLYSVMGAKMVESVYCDFTKLPDDAGFQTWIGLVDVKSLSTYFYGQKNTNFDQLNTPIPFDVVRLNEGGAFNGTTGIFTAPRNGKYFFSFAGLAHFPKSSSEHYLGVSLYLNGDEIGKAFTDDAGNSAITKRVPLALQSTLHLQKGNQVCLKTKLQTTGVLLTDDGNHFTHFNGWLLEEDISQ